MSQVSYIGVLNLAGEFKAAVENLLQSDPVMMARARAALTAEELSDMMDLMMEAAGTVLDAMENEGTFRESALAVHTKFLENFTVMAGRSIPEEQLVQLLPQSLRTAQVADMFMANNAPRLAALCRPKLAP